MDLQVWMDKEGANDQDLADRIGLTRGYISRIRRGLVHISLGTALELQKLTRGEIPLEMFMPLRLRPQSKRKAGTKAATQPKPRPKPTSKPPRPTPSPPPAAARKRKRKDEPAAEAA